MAQHHDDNRPKECAFAEFEMNAYPWADETTRSALRDRRHIIRRFLRSDLGLMKPR